jgi:hypothetical protein
MKLPSRLRIARNRKQVVGTIAAISLSPIIVVLILRLPLINQLNYADAWFYSSYAWVPKHDFEIFGWNYFAVRFPSTLSIGLFERAFGVGDGYVLLRYVLALACGTSVYLCVRRFASVQVSVAAAVLLYLQPFFSRSLLWDYTFAEVAAGVMGVSLWYWSEERRIAWTLLPGAALAAAAFANANFATGIFVLFVVEAVAAVRLGRRTAFRYGARLATAAVGAVGVFLIGYLSYLKILGSFGPYELLRPTVEFLRENSKNSGPYVQPVRLWLLHEPRLWMPVITSAALLAVLRGRTFGTAPLERIAQMCIAFTAFLWLYRFTVTSSVLEVWWSYSVLVAATAPALGVLLHELTGNLRKPKLWIAISVGAFALTAVIVRDVPGPSNSIYRAISEHRGLLLALLAIGLLSAALISVRSTGARATFSVIFVVVLSVMSFAPSVLDGRGTTGIFASSGSREWKGYEAGDQFMDLIQNYDSPSHRVFLWYPGTFGYVSIAWADLQQYGDTLNVVGAGESLGRLSPLGIARLDQPQVEYLMIMAPLSSELNKGLRALSRAGFEASTVHRGKFGEVLPYVMVRLTKK